MGRCVALDRRRCLHHSLRLPLLLCSCPHKVSGAGQAGHGRGVLRGSAPDDELLDLCVCRQPHGALHTPHLDPLLFHRGVHRQLPGQRRLARLCRALQPIPPAPVRGATQHQGGGPRPRAPPVLHHRKARHTALERPSRAAAHVRHGAPGPLQSPCPSPDPPAVCRGLQERHKPKLNIQHRGLCLPLNTGGLGEVRRVQWRVGPGGRVSNVKRRQGACLQGHHHRRACVVPLLCDLQANGSGG
mmetsp:Transcript_63123/g.151750  ORF Transcript_63123/g.151750 Transcript_63123/m.151750 type:complete len:243 (+) Transcript_63123:148-876(+)